MMLVAMRQLWRVNIVVWIWWVEVWRERIALWFWLGLFVWEICCSMLFATCHFCV